MKKTVCDFGLTCPMNGFTWAGLNNKCGTSATLSPSGRQGTPWVLRAEVAADWVEELGIF